jgi:hypothetical protein
MAQMKVETAKNTIREISLFHIGFRVAMGIQLQ